MTERSYGAVIYRRIDGVLKYLVIKNKKAGYWGFPKGHIEENETEEQAALREVYEEIGLKVKLDMAHRAETQYMKKNNPKIVTYFPAEPLTLDIKMHDTEIGDFKWLDYNESLSTLTYPRDKEVLEKFNKIIIQG